jgi:hypothetical protein
MFGVQQDEDQDDPDERHDPDSDMEVDDHKAVEESSRSLSSPSLSRCPLPSLSNSTH